ncbi:MAG: hypothetical protein ACJAXW_001632 [Candidatus Azotimanducaceae bacterium]|jgi:hypothetical protein
MARVLDQPIGDVEVMSRPKLPKVRELHQEIESINIDLLDFLQLGECELQQVVAEQNSSLGRFAAESQLLVHDVMFIELAGQCIARLSAESELAKTLEQAREDKRRNLGKRLWNAILAGPEYRLFWQVELADYPERIDSRVEFALQQLDQSVTDIMMGRQTDWRSMEHSLEVLRNGEGGALLESWRVVSMQLDVATELLKARAVRRPLCFAGMVNPKAEIFRTVVLNTFVSGIQRDLAVLNRRYYDLLVPIRNIERQLEHEETEHYQRYRQQRDKMLEVARGSVTAHVAALEPLMVQCGFLPELIEEP